MRVFKAPFDQGHGSKAASLVKVVIDEPGIKGRIQRPKFGFEAKGGLGLLHQGQEVGDIGLVEGLGQLCQDKLAVLRDFGGHHP